MMMMMTMMMMLLMMMMQVPPFYLLSVIALRVSSHAVVGARVATGGVAYTSSYSSIPVKELSALYDLYIATGGGSWKWKGDDGKWNFSSAGV